MGPPVFIVGCPRSGTSLLYHTLLPAGGFASYRTEMNVFNLLVPIFGDLSVLKNRKRMLPIWLKSKAFEATGLDAGYIEAKVLAECRNSGDFLRIVMEDVARKQNVERWVDSTPTNVLHIPEIKRAFPEALVIHIIRDGRDVALSLDKLGWSRPLQWEKEKSLMAAGLYWKWTVKKGRRNGQLIKPDYLELHYEDLVNRPREILPCLSRFINEDLDYDLIQLRGVGTLRNPASSFGTWGHLRASRAAHDTWAEAGSSSEGDGQPTDFSPVGCWKRKFPKEQLTIFEGLVGDLLAELGYALATPKDQSPCGFTVRRMRLLYPLVFNLKHWVRCSTPLTRFFVDYKSVLIDK